MPVASSADGRCCRVQPKPVVARQAPVVAVARQPGAGADLRPVCATGARLGAPAGAARGSRPEVVQCGHHRAGRRNRRPRTRRRGRTRQRRCGDWRRFRLAAVASGAPGGRVAADLERGGKAEAARAGRAARRHECPLGGARSGPRHCRRADARLLVGRRRGTLRGGPRARPPRCAGSRRARGAVRRRSDRGPAARRPARRLRRLPRICAGPRRAGRPSHRLLRQSQPDAVGARCGHRLHPTAPRPLRRGGGAVRRLAVKRRAAPGGASRTRRHAGARGHAAWRGRACAAPHRGGAGHPQGRPQAPAVSRLAGVRPGAAGAGADRVSADARPAHAHRRGAALRPARGRRPALGPGGGADQGQTRIAVRRGLRADRPRRAVRGRAARLARRLGRRRRGIARVAARAPPPRAGERLSLGGGGVWRSAANA